MPLVMRPEWTELERLRQAETVLDHLDRLRRIQQLLVTLPGRVPSVRGWLRAAERDGQVTCVGLDRIYAGG